MLARRLKLWDGDGDGDMSPDEKAAKIRAALRNMLAIDGENIPDNEQKGEPK